jgi:hypothetical protein
VGKILGFSGSRESIRIIYIEINGNFIFDLRIFTLRTIFIERITSRDGCISIYKAGFTPNQLEASNRRYTIHVAHKSSMHVCVNRSHGNDIAFNIIAQWQAIRVESNFSSVSLIDTYRLSIWR